MNSRDLALRVRRHVLHMTHRAATAHVGTGLSMADLLAVLYSGILRIEPGQPEDPLRDRFVLSKGHGAAGLYAVLAERAFFPLAALDNYYQNGSALLGHASHKVSGVEVSTGALGHGLAIACGLALGFKRDAGPQRVFALLSDGECDEGSTWEAALFAPHHRLDNLTVIIDYNKIQSLGRVSDVLALEPFADKWRAFGWETREIDGHDHVAIFDALRTLPAAVERPTCIIAHTVKGKGVAFMEDKLLWHYRSPNVDELSLALEELERR
jgi:transketolase